jgi:hypothetical protein
MLGESYLDQGLTALGRSASRPMACAIALRGDRLPHLRRRLPMYGRGCAGNCSVFHWPFFVVPHYYLFRFVRYERDDAENRSVAWAIYFAVRAQVCALASVK